MSKVKVKVPMSAGMTKPQREAKLLTWIRALLNGGEVKEIDRQELKDSNGNINRIDVTVENTYNSPKTGL